jgi:hypothetical protein
MAFTYEGPRSDPTSHGTRGGRNLTPPDVDPTQTPKRCEIEGEMAEGVGFEPTDTSLHHSISNRAP